MGQLDKQPENSGTDESQAAEARLKSMAQDIEYLRQTLIGELSQDVERLQREKSQLIEDIDKLQIQHQQQLVQQQQLFKQIAPTLANQVIELLTQRLDRLGDSPNQQAGQSPELEAKRSPRESLNPTANNYNENAYQLISSLDATLRATFRTLQRDLSSYQSSLSQQLAQMYNLEQQGEAILEALVSRLREEIQAQSSAIESISLPPPAAPPSLPQRNGRGYSEGDRNTSIVSSPSEPPVPIEPLMLEQGRVKERENAQPISPPHLTSEPQKASKLPLGFLLVLLASLLLAFQNVIITLIFNKSPLFGGFELGGFIAPSLGNSLFVLWLRMLVVVPLMALLTTRLYPLMWQDIKQFAQSKDWSLYFRVFGSGLCLFLSQVLVYLALGAISPGVAITIFFIYPIVTVLMAWVLFSDRPSLVRSFVIFIGLLGFIAITVASSRVGELSRLGVSAATGSGIAFAFYIILMQTCGKKINPIPCSWIHFVILLTFSSLSLASPLSESWVLDVDPTQLPGAIVSCTLLGGITLLSYLLNNFGIRRIGAAKASMLGATVPALTALLALIVIQKGMQVQQIFGMLLVTIGVAALSFEQWHRQSKAAQSAVKKSR